jgi:hypothetical protein
MGLHHGQANFVTYGKPSLFLDFANKKSLVDRISGNNLITFERASIGTYVGADGLIKTAAADEARFDHDPATGKSLGLLIEEQRSNIYTGATTYGFQSTTNEGFTTSPDGTETANKIRISGDGYHRFQYNINPFSSGNYSFSIFFKNIEGSNINPATCAFQFIDIGGNGGSGGYISPSSVQIYPNGWRRIKFENFNVNVSSFYVTYFYLNTSGGNLFDANNDLVGVWGGQLELGSFTTSYIPKPYYSITTRQSDTAIISGTNFSSWFNTTKGTIIADFKSNTISTTNSNILSFDDGTRYPWPIYRFQPDNYWKWYNGNDSIVNIASGFSTITKFGLTFDQTNGSSSLSGTLTQQDNYALRVASKYAGSSRLYIFRNIPDGYNAVHSGTLKQLIYYPTRLTNAQLQSLTQ